MVPRAMSSPLHSTLPPAQAKEQFSSVESPISTTGSRGVTTSLSAGRPGQEESAGSGEGTVTSTPQLGAPGQGAAAAKGGQGGCHGSVTGRPRGEAGRAAAAGPGSTVGRGIRVAPGPVALTAAAPQRAEEEKDRSRLHHPQGSSRAGFPFFPSFPPSRERVPLAGAVSFWPPAPTSALLKSCRNRPHEHRPQDRHNFQPKGYFQREVSDFLPSSALTPHPDDSQAGSPPKPGKAPVLKGPPSPHGAALHRHLHPGMWLRSSFISVFAGYITPPEPPANQPFHDPNSCWGHTAVERALSAPAPKVGPGPEVSPVGGCMNYLEQGVFKDVSRCSCEGWSCGTDGESATTEKVLNILYYPTPRPSASVQGLTPGLASLPRSCPAPHGEMSLILPHPILPG